MSMKPTIEKMMHAKYLSEVRGGNKRIPQCHIQKDWQDYLFAIVQFFLCVYLRATIVSSSEILGTRILSISAAHIGALRHLLLNFQTKNLSKMTHFVGEDFKRIWEKYEELFRRFNWKLWGQKHTIQFTKINSYLLVLGVIISIFHNYSKRCLRNLARFVELFRKTQNYFTFHLEVCTLALLTL